MITGEHYDKSLLLPVMKKINLKSIWVILQQATKGFSDDRVLKMSGSLPILQFFPSRRSSY